MIEIRVISVSLNINPKYLHPNLIQNHINEQLNQIIKNNCFQELGKVLKINKIISIGYGKIHIDTGYSKIPVTFEAEICIPKVDETITGIIEKYDTNGGIYVNYENIISIFCLKPNINQLLNNKENLKTNSSRRISFNEVVNETNDQSNENNYEIGDKVNVKITKVTFNEQDIIVIGKII